MQLNRLNAQSSPQPLSNYMVDADWEYVCTRQDAKGDAYNLLVHPSIHESACKEDVALFMYTHGGDLPTIKELNYIQTSHSHLLGEDPDPTIPHFIWSSTASPRGVGRLCLDLRTGAGGVLMWELFACAGCILVKREYLHFVG